MTVRLLAISFVSPSVFLGRVLAFSQGDTTQPACNDNYSTLKLIIRLGLTSWYHLDILCKLFTIFIRLLFSVCWQYFINLAIYYICLFQNILSYFDCSFGIYCLLSRKERHRSKWTSSISIWRQVFKWPTLSTISCFYKIFYFADILSHLILAYMYAQILPIIANKLVYIGQPLKEGPAC